MKLGLAIPAELRALAWRVQEPAVLDVAWHAFPEVTETLATGEGWGVALAPDPTDASLFAIYEIGPFVAVVHVGPVSDADFDAVLATLLAATVRLVPAAPVALTELMRTPAPAVPG